MPPKSAVFVHGVALFALEASGAGATGGRFRRGAAGRNEAEAPSVAEVVRERGKGKTELRAQQKRGRAHELNELFVFCWVDFES